ncbi:MAG: MaoC family dehydratase N-terminal domain-containing protein [Nocardioidaceae bacterium]
MALDPALSGRTFATPAPYEVSAERIAEFARAIQADPVDEAGTAPFTFPIVVAFALMGRLMTDPSVGIELRNVVHRDERIEQVRPVRAGDSLVGTLTVESVRAAAGVDLIATRTEISTVGGEAVCAATATLVHRGGDS